MHLHAHFAGDPRLSGPWDWAGPLVGAFEATAGQTVAPFLIRRGLRRAGTLVPDALRGPALDYARHRTRVGRALDGAPRTLLHHDCHPGNLAFGPGPRVWLTDWQLVRSGPWARDVAYLVATSLPTEERRAHEQDLLACHLDASTEAGGAPPATTAARDAYRRHLVYAFEAMVVTLGIGTVQPDERVRPVVARTAAAVGDHDAFALC